MAGVVGFEAYQHRAKRQKLLEEIYQASQAFLNLASRNLPCSLALAILSDKVERLRQYEKKTPPPKEYA